MPPGIEDPGRTGGPDLGDFMRIAYDVPAKVMDAPEPDQLHWLALE